VEPYLVARQAILAVAKRFGLEVRRICPVHNSDLALLEMLRHYDADLVLDVGANVGQFAQNLLEIGWDRRIVSFEPLSQPHAAIVAASARHPNWQIAERCAIGDHNGEIEVHISENSVASSVLPLADSMDQYSPEARYVSKERVPIYTLDDALAKLRLDARRPFLKVDVQGFEEQVLAGAARTLEQAVGLQIELSFIELYAGQMLFGKLLERIERAGFVVHRMDPSFFHVPTGRWLQADVIAFRTTS
jgi:FkbM family methyltransferase